jgi:DNA-directed RNA polymerase specialized sigma24 family protein
MEICGGMPLTFEERVSEELDALYAGALFLSGGHETRASDLVVEAVRLASSEYSGRGEIGSFTQWMEGMLVRSLLRDGSGEGLEPRTWGGKDAGPDQLDAAALDGLGWADLVGAAAVLPPQARVAVWLVTLRRWSYEQVERTMGVGRDGLRELLACRAQLVGAAVAGSTGGKARGTGG